VIRSSRGCSKRPWRPASSASTSSRGVVSYFGSCGLFCYDLSGKEFWKFEMPPATIAGNFGSGASPILADGLVVLVRDEMKDPKILALDAATGKRKWEKKRRSMVSYCTPVVWDTKAGKQVVAAGHGQMVGYDLRTGAERWSVAGMPSGCCSSPVTAGGILYFAGWSPGGPDDKENQMPPFDAMLKKLDKDKDGALSREEAGKAFACEAYTLSCPDPEAEGPDSEAEDADLLLRPRGHGGPAGLLSRPRRSPTAADGR
jgi:hypothetical protein